MLPVAIRAAMVAGLAVRAMVGERTPPFHLTNKRQRALPAGMMGGRRRGGGCFWTCCARREIVARAVRCAGMSAVSARRLRGRDAGFAAAWDLALDESRGDLQAVAVRRALGGMQAMAAGDGNDKAWAWDGMVIALLKAALPERQGGGAWGGRDVGAPRTETERRTGM